MLLKLLRLVVVIASLVGALPPASSAQESHSAQSPESKSHAANFAGCYELHMGRWWPWSLGEDAKFATPPSQFELSLQRATEGFAKGQLIIRQSPSGERSWRISYWMLTGTNKAAAIWSTEQRRIGTNDEWCEGRRRDWDIDVAPRGHWSDARGGVEDGPRSRRGEH